MSDILDFIPDRRDGWVSDQSWSPLRVGVGLESAQGAEKFHHSLRKEDKFKEGKAKKFPTDESSALASMVSLWFQQWNSCTHFDVDLCFAGNFHYEFASGFRHVLENAWVNTTPYENRGLIIFDESGITTDTAPRLSELDTKRYSFPCAIKRSRTPERSREW